MASDSIPWPVIRAVLGVHAPLAVEDMREAFQRLGYRVAPPSPSSLQVSEAARDSDANELELAGAYEYITPKYEHHPEADTRPTIRTPEDAEIPLVEVFPTHKPTKRGP